MLRILLGSINLAYLFTKGTHQARTRNTDTLIVGDTTIHPPGHPGFNKMSGAIDQKVISENKDRRILDKKDLEPLSEVLLKLQIYLLQQLDLLKSKKKFLSPQWRDQAKELALSKQVKVLSAQTHKLGFLLRRTTRNKGRTLGPNQKDGSK
jgi:hypothetical protein